MLGKLAKWLRILGFDTLYSNSWKQEQLLRCAVEGKRIILTRNTHFIRRIPESVPFLFLEHDSYWYQLGEVVRHLGIRPDPHRFFTRCSECNFPLEYHTPEQMAGKVPEYVRNTQDLFACCPGCQRIYWSGTHRRRAEEMVKEILSQAGNTDSCY